MAITTNSLGTYSTEIVVTQTSNTLAVFNSVNTFIYSQGWSLVSDATITGNSTNRVQRVYQAANLTTGSYANKYVRINIMDLTLDTAQSYNVGVSGGTYNFANVSAGGNSYRFNNYIHFSYPRDSYFYATLPLGTEAGTVGYQATTNAQVAISGIQGQNAGQVTTNSWTIAISAGANTGYPSATAWSVSFSSNTGKGWQFYTGQLLILYSPSTGNYAMATVAGFNDATGALTMNNILHATSAASVATDWTLIVPNTLQYNQYTSPAYVYVSASARHLAIQTRNVDGVWNDWTAVCELENPLNLTGCTPWGLTTGYMSSNSGYTEVTNGTVGFAPYTLNSTYTISNLARYQWATTTLTPSNGASTRQTALPFMNKNGKYVLFTGPFSVPLTYKGRGSGPNPAYVGNVNIASQFNRVVTSLGEAGYIGTIKKEQVDWVYELGVSQSGGVGVNAQATVYYKGLGDVMPNTVSTAGGNKHYAVSCTLVTDIGDSDGTFTGITDATQLDTYTGFPLNQTGSTSNVLNSTTLITAQGNVGSYRDMSMWRTTQPTPMGRIYAMKAATTGLGPVNTITVRVDSNLMATSSSTGSLVDHLVFNYPSQYFSPTLNIITAGNAQVATNTYHYFPVDIYKGKETALDQANIRISQSASVAFPK